MTKICFIAPKAYPVFNPDTKNAVNNILGGGEVQIFLLSKELAKIFETYCIVGDYSQKKSEIVENVNLEQGYYFKSNAIIRFIKLFLTINKINADIYIQRALEPGSGVIALICKLKKKKFIYMIAHNDEVNGNYEKNHNFISTFFAFFAFKLADSVIAQTDYERLLFERKFKRKCIVMKNVFPMQDKKQFKKKTTVLWVARSDKWKRPEIFLRLAKINPDKIFIMICPPAKDRKDYYFKIRNKANLLKNIEFIDYVPFNKISKYFDNAKVFVNTSTEEGFPNTFLQAANSGTPILSLNVNPDNFINEYKCGFDCNDSFEQLNGHLNEFFFNESLYNEFSMNIRSYLKKNHDIKTNSEILINEIESINERRPT